MLLPVVLAAILALAHGGRSPNADLVEELSNSDQASRYSNSVILDALLDVPALVARYNYPIEFHDVVTEDGYVLQLHRIPHGRDRNNVRGGDKPVVFLMHGLLVSSADYLVLGPRNALGYLLAEEGFDVWLGNARGNYYSRRHLTLDPDTDTDFWRFSWDEIGFYDLSASIDYVLETTGQEKLHYIGHSQGGTSFLVLTSLRPEYNSKIASFHGLAPASFFAHNEKRLFNVAAPYQRILEGLYFQVTTGELLRSRGIISTVALAGCSDYTFLQPLCHSLPLIGGTIQNFNTTMIPVFLGHAPAGASIRQVAHYGQSINTGEFRRYDHGLFGNLAAYSRTTPPAYKLERITTPAYLYYGLADSYVHHNDLYHLAERLGNVERIHRVSRENFGHIEFNWGPDLKDVFYDDFIQILKEAVRKHG